jgi:hypothetical protein
MYDILLGRHNAYGYIIDKLIKHEITFAEKYVEQTNDR